jgi:hypothetical protein
MQLHLSVKHALMVICLMNCKNYLDWEGPRASQNLILAAKHMLYLMVNIRQILKMLKQSQLVSCVTEL